MNTLSCFFAAFLLFAGQAHGIPLLSLSSDNSQVALTPHSNILEDFSERFAQARIPTQEDFVVGRSIELSCTEYVYDGRRVEGTSSLTLSESGVVHTSNVESAYLTFKDQGLMGAFEDEVFSYRSAYRIENDGKWIKEWMAKPKKEGASEEAGHYWYNNATPSVADPDYRVISYVICK